MRRGVIVLLGVVAAAGLLAFAFTRAFRKETVREYVGPGVRARQNPYLAAQQILERLGARTDSVDGSVFLHLPHTDQTLVVACTRELVGPDQTADLLRWIKAGGYLVVTAAPEKPDRLLDGLGVSVVHSQELQAAESLTTQITAPPWSGAGAFAFQRTSEYVLRYAGSRAAWITPDGAPAALFVPRGKGAVTVVVDGYFMTNARIGEDDNAELLWHLATGPDDRRRVTLVAWEGYPGLPALAVRYAFPAVISAAVALAAFLWHAAFRFGPAQRPPQPERRGITEHIEATGRFFWRTRQAQLLLDAMGREEGWRSADRRGRIKERAFVDAVAEMQRRRMKGRY